MTGGNGGVDCERHTAVTCGIGSRMPLPPICAICVRRCNAPRRSAGSGCEGGGATRDPREEVAEASASICAEPLGPSCRISSNLGTVRCRRSTSSAAEASRERDVSVVARAAIPRSCTARGHHSESITHLWFVGEVGLMSMVSITAPGRLESITHERGSARWLSSSTSGATLLRGEAVGGSDSAAFVGWVSACI